MRNKFMNVITILFLALVATAILFSYKNVKNNSNNKCPFKISKIITVSTASGEEKEHTEELWKLDLMQNNDIYIYVEENKVFNKDKQEILAITLENFKLIDKDKEIEIYKLIAEENMQVNFDNENKIEEKIIYKIDEIQGNNNFSNIVAFRQKNSNIKEYEYVGTEIVQDGRLLAMAGITEEEIQTTISFDIIIETNHENKYKANVKLNLPAKDLIENGRGILEDEDLSNITFDKI